MSHQLLIDTSREKSEHCLVGAGVGREVKWLDRTGGRAGVELGCAQMGRGRKICRWFGTHKSALQGFVVCGDCLKSEGVE